MGFRRIIKLILFNFLIYLSIRNCYCNSESEKPYPDSSVFNGVTQRPILNYRRNVLGIRYGEPIVPTQSLIPRLTIKSYEDPKTEIHAPIYDEEEEEEPIEIISNQKPIKTIPTIPSGLRRNFPLQISTSSDSSNIEEIKEKSKTKSTRRRKVKRPPKPKSTTPKSPEDDLRDPEQSSSKSTSSSSGDKNLALEIGSGDGKYALINNFFGNTTSSSNNPPGIISYAQSDDFQNDNKKTLGNIDENDIWLSEGHLLVLKGGDFDSTSRDKWEPIDAYERDKSKRPLRIPLDTDNPPPFPIFINESGPPVFLGPPPPFLIPGYGEFNESFDPSRLPPPGLIPLFPNGTMPQFIGPPPYSINNSRPPFQFGPPNGPGLYGNGGIGPPGGVYGNGPPPPGNSYGNNYGSPPFNNNSSFPPPFFPFNNNGKRQPPPHPLFPFGPPGNGPPPGFNPNFTGGPFPFLPPLVLNPKDNETDDPSIFLPPPYDFDYYEDNSTIVPPGPFAPGLVVPPPKDFYSVYNKTTPPIFIPTTTIPYVSFKPQRPNGKKPKFPITNPPDDSIEANLPPPTTPFSVITFPKKRKQGRGKYSKNYHPNENSNEVQNEPPNHYQSIPFNEHLDIINFKPRQVSPVPTPTPPKQLQNYVYVRGKLKTLAEIAGEAIVDELGEPTPPPPFDERGYPNRDVSYEQSPSPPVPVVHQLPRPKKTKGRKEPPKIYFTSHEIHPTPFTLRNINNQNPQFTPLVYSQNSQQQQQSQIDEPRNNNHHHGQVVYPQQDNVYQNQGFIGPTYYTTNDQNTQIQPSPLPQGQLFQPQILQQVPYNSQGQNLNQGSYPPSSPQQTYTQQFQPVEQPKKQRHRSRIIFPDEDERQRKARLQQQLQQHLQNQQPQQQIYSNPHLFQPQGYYSPISQYRTTLSGQFIPNTYYPNGGFPGTFTTQFYNPAIQQETSPFFQQPQQKYIHQNYPIQQQYQQQPQNTFTIRKLPQENEERGQVVPLHQDILVNYREPLPQYNSESESITTRSVLKAGPSSSGIYGTQPTGEESAVPVSTQGTFYSFERGGPGGFSYKIRL